MSADAGRRGRLGSRQAILQLEHDPFRRLLADAGNGGETGDVSTFHRLYQFLRFDSRQDGERQLGTNPAHSNQPLEQHLLQSGGKPEERERVLPNVGMNSERDFAARLAQTVEGRQRHENVVSHTRNVDDEVIRLLLEDPSAQMPNHWRAGL